MEMENQKSFLKENEEALRTAQKRAEKAGYRIYEIEKAAKLYVQLAEKSNLNLVEFDASLKKASSMVHQSLSRLALLDIKAAEKKWSALEKRVADLEGEVQSQPELNADINCEQKDLRKVKQMVKDAVTDVVNRSQMQVRSMPRRRGR